MMAARNGDVDSDWKRENISAFSVPAIVASSLADRGKRIAFPQANPVSPLVRINVLEAQNPIRHKITVPLGDPSDEANDYWQPFFTFFVFACPMPYTQPYTIEYRRDPFGTRLRLQRNPQPRDTSNWKMYDPAKGFFAYPEPMPGTTNYAVEWTSGPDRYITTEEESRPPSGWLRCLRLNAYAASKYHLCEASEPSLCYRVMRGPKLIVERPWRCIFAFYAFDNPAPGTTQIYVQYQETPHYRTRISTEPSEMWQDLYSFYVFEMPMPGTSHFEVQVVTRSPDTRDVATEQGRISTKDAWEPWQQFYEFYAYPAASLLF